MIHVILAFISAVVFQEGDTLFFSSSGASLDTVVLADSEITDNGREIVITRKAKVSPDSTHFFLFNERYFRHNDSIATELAIYDAGKKLRWRESQTGDTVISFGLTKIFGPYVALAVTAKDNTRPGIDFIDTRTFKRRTIIKRGQWPLIVNWELSPNLRHLALYARKRVNGKTEDFIYSRDLETDLDWSYLFPICLSCRRGAINLYPGNQGQVDVKYKNEHRIFSNTGELIDFYLETE
jgi:hypothetical protein